MRPLCTLSAVVAIFLVVASLQSGSVTASPIKVSEGVKEYYDICDQVTLLGYPCQHEVAITEDGFELDVIHMAQPNKGKNTTGGNYPVVLQHGLLDSAITWVANAHSYQNLACILFDQGYDVFLPNSRGNHYSLGNDMYSPDEATYWRRIDMDGMAKYDLPAVVHLVLNRTGSPTLTWVGHSQGTWQAFTAFGNLHPNLAKDKVDLFVALAPVAYVAHQSSFILGILADLDVAGILKLFGDKTFLENDWLLRQVSRFCKDLGELCPSLLELVCGDGNPANTNATQIPTILRYDPGGTSTNNMVHWQQEVTTKKYQAHDYGFFENEKLYHQASPPQYHLDTMLNPPTALFSGSRDALADPQDVATIIKELPNATLVQHEVIQDFAHLDFVWGLDAASKLYNPYVVPLINKYAKKQQSSQKKN